MTAVMLLSARPVDGWTLPLSIGGVTQQVRCGTNHGAFGVFTEPPGVVATTPGGTRARLGSLLTRAFVSKCVKRRRTRNIKSFTNNTKRS